MSPTPESQANPLILSISPDGSGSCTQRLKASVLYGLTLTPLGNILPRISNGGPERVAETQPKVVTDLLLRWKGGDQGALHDLLPLVYPELRRVAHNYLRKERVDHTLQSTALVHEAYLRLQKQANQKFENRSHFFAICAQLMRQILVEYARGRQAAKRGGRYKLSLDEAVAPAKRPNFDLVALDDALNKLEKLDPQQSRVVELRFFAGLSIEETSDVLGISPATVKREWSTARVWLHHEMRAGAPK